jgi:trimeric autotransporter adhesin
MATYDNDLRLKEIATEEEDGTWGTSTNVNLELIGEALSYGTQDCFASDADATTTVADSATDPARSMYFKVTSSATLTATRTLTIAPNTISRVMWIENATTGSQSITISQGSGGTVTIPTGDVKVVYLDGAGAGAAVVDAFTNLNLADVSSLVATTVDINGGSIDGTIIGAASPAAGTFTTATATTGAITTVNSTTVNATTVDATSVEVTNVKAKDGTASATIADSTGVMTISSSVLTTTDINGGTIDGVTIGGSSAGAGNFTTLDASGTLTVTGEIAANGGIALGDNDKATFGAGDDLQIYHTGSASIIEDQGTGDLVIKGTDLYLRNSSNANRLYAGTDVRLYHDANQKLATTATGIDVTGTVTATGTSVFASLDISGDIDVDGTTNLDVVDIDGAVDMASTLAVADDANFDSGTLFVDASANKVGVGTSAPSTKLHVDQGGDNNGITLANSARGTAKVSMQLSGVSNEEYSFFHYDGTDTDTLSKHGRTQHTFNINNAEAMRINSSGHVGIGTGSPATALDVVGTVTADGLTVAGNLSVDGGTIKLDGNYPTGLANVALGNTALSSGSLSGGYNVAIGADSMVDNTTGNVNVAVGANSLENNTTGYENVSIGGGAMYTNTTGFNNVAVGRDALRVNTTASNNTAVGYDSLAANTTASNNTAVGYNALTANTTGTKNVCIGYGAGDAITTGSNNTIIGDYAGTTAMADTIVLASGTTERLRIDSSGKVGIGTTSPSEELTIRAAVPKIQIEDSDGTNQYGQFYHSAGSTVILVRNDTSDGTIIFQKYDGTTTDETMRIDSSGNVLVGTTTTDRTADAGLNIDPVGFLDVSRTSNLAARFTRLVDTGNIVLFRQAATTVGSISVTGSATAYNTSSDYRLKENIADAEDAGDKIDAIQVRKYDWKADGSHQDYGMIAQELQTVAPEAVSGDADSEEMMGVDYSKLVPMLVKEIQSLRARITTLEG